MKQYRKIDIYVDGKYRLTTTRFKTCRGALLSYLKVYPEMIAHKINVCFQKGDL